MNKYLLGIGLVFLNMANNSLAQAAIYNCTPDHQHTCDQQGCTTTTENFAHAETFTLDTQRKIISACLWTACYEGRASFYHVDKQGEITAMGQLQEQGDNPDKSPRLLSLTKDANHHFTAVWSYSGSGLTFDMGVCQPIR
ncbi:MAG: hypothetical protein G8345_19405 [Magnetococcales bacterium]|nr:hypothetical protein [Magnetococcales bacterium]NGZ29044.1 hypothetical protein [Magnetococcales bacterium]